MRGHVILSHGLESGPDATKVTVLAQVAEAMGFTTERVDYRACGTARDLQSINARLALGLERAQAHAMAPTASPLILVGSSMGSFVSGLISKQVDCAGLFLLAPPIRMGDYPSELYVSETAPLVIVHGWDDELIAVDEVIDFAAENGAELHLVNDDHRLGEHVPTIARWFAEFLDRAAP